MIDIRKFDSLGHADHGWLDARHHFSFADYHDPSRMGWGRIRVWNDDRIAAKSGFPPHPHRDIQIMSAGTGVTHAEYNLEDEETTLFQIWIETDKPSAQPGWGAMPFPKESREGQFQLLASGDGHDGVLHINSDARILGATLKAGETLEYAADPARHLYLVPSAKVKVNGTPAEKRDGVAITGESTVSVKAEEDAELVLVDAR